MAEVVVYDPKVPEEQIRRDVLGPDVENDRLKVVSSAEEAADGAHAVAVLTEWDEFKEIDFAAVLAKMPKPAFLFDGRNLLDHDRLREIGFTVSGVGK
jgi:UDPglucose 6-dehydrogenase